MTFPGSELFRFKMEMQLRETSTPDIALQPGAETIHYSSQYSHAFCFLAAYLTCVWGNAATGTLHRSTLAVFVWWRTEISSEKLFI